MLKTKIPMRRKVPVLSVQKVAFIDAGELNPDLAVFHHLKQKPMDKAVECKDHQAAGCKDHEAAKCKDHEAAGDTSPSNTTLAKAETMKQNLPGTNPNGAREPKSSEEPVEIEALGQFITTLIEEEDMKQSPSGSNPTGPNTSQHQVSQMQYLPKKPISSDTSSLAEEPLELEGRIQFITENQLDQIKEIGKEQERVSKILENLAQKIKKILADIRGKDSSLGKWPQCRREITGILMAVIVALFIAVAVYLFTFWYNQKPVEATVPTWWEYVTSAVTRFCSLY